MKRWLGFMILLFVFAVENKGVVKAMETPKGQENVQTIYDSIPLEEVEDVLQELKEEEVGFSFEEYVDKVVRGDATLSLDEIAGQVREYVCQELTTNKQTILRLLLCGILAGVFLNFSSSLYEKQMGQTAFYVIYFFAAGIMAAGFVEAACVAQNVLERVLTFMKVLVPAFSISLTWSAGSSTSMAFYQAALAAISIVEQLLAGVFLPLVQVYFLLRMVNPLLDGRFTRMAALVRSFICFGTKIIFMVMIGQQGIQGLITPALDQVKRGTLFRTASSIPGVGNVFGGVTDTVIGTGVLIKSAIGVGGLMAICVLCIVPLIRLWCFTMMYKSLAAFVQPVSDQRIASVLQSAADSGRLLVHIVFMTAIMFLVTLSIVIAATNYGI